MKFEDLHDGMLVRDRRTGGIFILKKQKSGNFVPVLYAGKHFSNWEIGSVGSYVSAKMPTTLKATHDFAIAQKDAVFTTQPDKTRHAPHRHTPRPHTR